MSKGFNLFSMTTLLGSGRSNLEVKICTLFPRVEVWNGARALPEGQKTQMLVLETSLSVLLWEKHLN